MRSPLEIRAAARIADHRSGTLSEGEMSVAIARLLGFNERVQT
jgi:hypothetical protein